MTTRKAYSGRRRTGAEKSEETESETGNDQTDVSTDEPTIRGQLPAAEFDAIDDQSDDTHLYARKFEAFSAMVELLRTKGCRQVSGGIRKLPALAGYSKHLLEDGNPRCIAFHLLTKHGQSYALLEVDTSDNKNRLSTLLLKQPTPYFDWQGEITILEKNLLRKPLNWPTSHLKLVFPDHHKRISYPRTLSGNKGLVEPGSMQCWADRMYLALE